MTTVRSSTTTRAIRASDGESRAAERTMRERGTERDEVRFRGHRTNVVSEAIRGGCKRPRPDPTIAGTVPASLCGVYT